MPNKTPKKVKVRQPNGKAFAASRCSTSLVFSSLARKVKFALERGELGVSDPDDAWSKAYFLNRAETEQLRRWLNREAKSNDKLSDRCPEARVAGTETHE